MIQLNCDPNLKLPHIYIPEIDSVFMIDTGSTRSFISPDKANEYYSAYKYVEPFKVVSTHATSQHSEVISIPLMPTFCSNQEHKFYIYNVDSRYDGLIGSDLLKELEASVDMKDQILHTRFTSIPIIYNPAPYNVKLHARSEQRVKLPTDQYSGHAILNFKEFCPGVRMPTAIVQCNNGYATTIIQNLTDKDITIGITRPFLTSAFIEDTLCDVNYTTQQDIEIDKILEQNLYNKLRLDHMTDEERIRIQNLCIQYKDIFYCEDLPLTFTSQVKHQIRTKNEDPIYVKPYRLAPAQTEEINRQVQKLLKDDVIRESHSPWCAPVHLVPKRSDASGEIKYRMVIDYRRLNDLTTDDKYPLPNITDLFDKLGKSTYFSTIDLASGYHQIELEESDKQKTAFSTQHGHFEFQRMPFGLKTAPATFQRAMDSVLRGLQGIHCLVYLDDIIVYSSSLEEHIRKLRAVFDRLRQTNLKVQLDKTEFLRKEVLYLGHKITKDGLKPNEDKIKAVMDFPIPKTTTEIKSFLGLVGYYRKFIKDFAKITQPLTNCLKKRNKISIDTDYINAFNKCKELLCNAPLLQYPDPSKPYILTTDASNVALGGVLSQGPIGSDKPIAYASRTLSDTESRYSTIERELLAIIWAIKHFRPYLYGQKFFIYTDHRPLAWLNSMKDPSSKLTRWRLSLQDYNFEIIYKNGKQNTNADALSRIKVNATDSDDDVSMKVNVDQKEQKLQKHIDSLTKEITKLTRKKSSSTLSISDSERTHTISPISEVISISSGDKEPTQFVPSVSSSADTIHSAVDMETTGIPILHEAIDTKPNQLLIFTWFRDTCQVKDLSRNKQKVLEVHLPLDNEQLIKDFLKKYIKLKTKYFIYFENQEHRRLFTNIIIQLFRQDMVQFYECTERVIYVEDEDEQKQIIIKHHEGKTVHRGIKETIARIRRNYYWQNLQETVTAVLNACEVCKKMKYDRKPIKPMLQLTQTQDAPFQELFIDLFTIDGKYYLTIIDAFSKLAQAIEITNRSTPEVLRALIKYFSFYGIPKKISSDPGSEFNNELMRELMTLYKIQLHIGTPHNPNSMGLIERFHSTIIEIYRLAKYEQKCTDASTVMTYCIMAYNHTIHSATGLTPFEVVFGHTDTGIAFDINFQHKYMQQLIKDHAKRTQYLYKHLSQKLMDNKETVRQKKGGETNINLPEGKVIFSKVVNTRQSKDKPIYQKAKVTGKTTRNVVPIKVGQRNTKAPIKNIKRPPQVVSADIHGPQPGPSSAIT